MDPGPHPPLPDTYRELDLIGVVVFLPCHHPCCDPLRQITATHPVISSFRKASDTEALEQAARPRGARAMSLPRPPRTGS